VRALIPIVFCAFSKGAGLLRLCLWPLCIASTLFSAAYADDPASAAHTELQRRNSELVEKGFNFTHGFELNAAHSQRMRIELLIPPSEHTHEVSFWGSARGGEASFRLTTGDNQVLALWQGHSGGTDMTISLPTGRNNVEIDLQNATSVVALRAYRSSRLKAQFKLYPAVGHEVSNDMQADIETFLTSVISQPSAQ
jgi:hypothetical protein